MESQWNHVFPVSGVDGRFRIGPLLPGVFDVEIIDHRGRWPTQGLGRVTLAAHAEHDCGTTVLRLSGELVVQLDRGETPPHQRIRARVFREDGRHESNARVDGDMITPYSALSAGRYRLAIFGTGIRLTEVAFEILGGQTTTVPIRRERGVERHLRIDFPAPVRDNQRLSLVLHDAGGAVVSRRDLWVEPTGTFTLTLGPGAFTVDVMDDAGRRGRATLTVDSAMTADTTEAVIELR